MPLLCQSLRYVPSLLTPIGNTMGEEFESCLFPLEGIIRVNRNHPEGNFIV